jgi:hypothetical protein
MVHAAAIALLLVAPSTARAGLYERVGLPWFSAELGVSGAGPKLPPHAAWGLGFGYMWGPSIGEQTDIARLWGLGLRVRQDIRPLGEGALETRTAPMLELRRELDLLIFSAGGAVLAGPLFSSNAPTPVGLVGGTVRVAGYAGVGRIHSHMVGLRLEAGVDAAPRVTPLVALTLQVEKRLP